MNKVTMIDYGIGNYRSVQKALDAVGAKVVLSSDPDEIASADKLVLPGVGAFGATMDALRQRQHIPAIAEAVARGRYLLGICVGMQVLLDDSDELGVHQGLGLIGGHVCKFSEKNNLKIPHIGWNQLHHDGTSPLLQGIPNGDYAYFVHSFACHPTNRQHTVAHSDYGGDFAAIVGRDSIFGLQFHAEKSQNVGLRILKNYLNL